MSTSAAEIATIMATWLPKASAATRQRRRNAEADHRNAATARHRHLVGATRVGPVEHVPLYQAAA